MAARGARAAGRPRTAHRACSQRTTKTIPGAHIAAIGPTQARKRFKVVPIIAHIHSDVEIETSIIALGREPGGGLVVMPSGFMTVHRALLSLLYSETLFLAWLLVKLAFLLAVWCGLAITAVVLALTAVVAVSVGSRRQFQVAPKSNFLACADKTDPA